MFVFSLCDETARAPPPIAPDAIDAAGWTHPRLCTVPMGWTNAPALAQAQSLAPEAPKVTFKGPRWGAGNTNRGATVPRL